MNLKPITEFCKEKDIARQTVYDLIRKGKLQTKKMGYARFVVMDKFAINYQKSEPVNGRGVLKGV